MKHTSSYLDWYTHVPHVKYDFRSSGLTHFRHNVNLGEIDLSENHVNGNPEAVKQLAKWYFVEPENVFISSEGASGQNARIIRCLAERNPRKKEAIVEYPTYEPLLRAVQEHFPRVRRLVRQEDDAYRLDAERLEKVASERTGLLVFTNPHAPSGAIAHRREQEEIMKLARELDFHVMCDEIYAEFDRRLVPTLFSVDEERGIVTTSFTKAYGLGGLKLGVALAEKRLVDELYKDVLNTVGNAPNIVQLVASELLTKGRDSLRRHKRQWRPLKIETEKRLTEMGLKYYPNRVGVTYWLKLPVKNSYNWINKEAIRQYSLATVPGAFFLFANNNKIAGSNMTRLGLGSINPERSILGEALDTLQKALEDHRKHAR